uniref:Transmembrane protein n=1 Tax=Palpitomonas bilix TaxID=652834 RepID=A0A7S3D778_9EUKA|mmetsp:Transcript_22830/g.58109  ORF Transcript_22830/g.58109 Transcript_22830/m.58109 type:complete len:221 (+) Transcript_22830:158-820(+)
MFANSGSASLLLAFVLLPACLASSIPFDALREANVTGILASSDAECSSIISKLTSEKCFDDTVVLTSGDTVFFIPLMARDTPECFDYAAYSEGFSPLSPKAAEAKSHFFKADTIVTKVAYTTFTNTEPVRLDLATGESFCITLNTLKAGKVGIAKPAPEDVSPDDVAQWKRVITVNIDMLEEKYGSEEGSRLLGVLSFQSIVFLILVVAGAVLGILSVLF